MINHCWDKIPDKIKDNLDSIFRYNRGPEYFEYLKATYEVSGIDVEEIGKEYISALKKIMS